MCVLSIPLYGCGRLFFLVFLMDFLMGDHEGAGQAGRMLSMCGRPSPRQSISNPYCATYGHTTASVAVRAVFSGETVW